MLAKSIYEYYWFGTCIRFIQDAEPGVLLGDGTTDGGMLTNLNKFFDYLNNLALPVTYRASQELEKLRVELAPLDRGTAITPEIATRLRTTMGDLRRTLEAELMGMSAFVVTPKVLDTGKLLNNVPALFSPGVFQKLPEIARFDFSEAAGCIAFERPTAAAFHALRGTESVLRAFYAALVKQKRVKSQLWGPLIDDLRKRKKAESYSALLNHLDHIRHSFRNPTQHPEKIYDINEVQDLWSLCVDASNRMSKAFPDAA